jgi:hypothetical protein
MQNLGGYNTGPFRRVYIGCTGYTQQDVTFISNMCGISDYQTTSTDLHGAYLGAYTLDGNGAIDAGLIYNRKNDADPGLWQDVMLRKNVTMYGSFFSCGLGKYSSTVLIAKSAADFNQ